MHTLKLNAEHVAAYLWARANTSDRYGLCDRAGVSPEAAHDDWHHLNHVERIPLTAAIVDAIETEHIHRRAA